MTPRRWSLAQLEQDAETAKREFREARLREPLERYSTFFKSFAPIAAETIDRLHLLLEDPINVGALAEQVGDPDRLTVLRYLPRALPKRRSPARSFCAILALGRVAHVEERRSEGATTSIKGRV